MSEAPAWHASARRLIDSGMSIVDTARAIGKSTTAVRFALDINGAREKALAKQRKARAKERALTKGARKREHSTTRRIDRTVVAAYSEPKEKVRAPLTLPKVSIPALPDEDLRQGLRFAPRTRLTASPGAERWREHHQRMQRRGLIPGADIVSEWRQ